jgi:dihydroorotase
VEDIALRGDGVMNEGERATRLGLRGVPPEAEALMLERDLTLVAMTGVRYHAALISSSLSVERIRRAKAAGLPVTCGVSINHLTLNENDIGEYRTFLKFSPPLRGEEERVALIEAVADGVIDVIVSDHNPQDVETKRLPFATAADGAVGLETLLPAALRLVQAGHLTLSQMMRALSAQPANILRLPQGRLRKGAPADLMCFDADVPWVVDPAQLLSRCKNTPFEQSLLQGRVSMTIVGGAIVYRSPQ